MPETSSLNTTTAFEMPFQPVGAGEADRLLRELDWGEHFVGSSLNPAMGNNKVYVYSLKEMLRFLTQGGASLGVLQGSSRVGISWVDPPKLLHWLRASLGDEELADVIEQSLAQDGEALSMGAANIQAVFAGDTPKAKAYLVQLKAMAELTQLRIAQLEEAQREAQQAQQAQEEAG